ncbi:hypothetical protein V3C99_005684 [Haemonchus contortus]
MHVRGARLNTHDSPYPWVCLGECLGNIKCNLAVLDDEGSCLLFGESNNSTSINTVYNVTEMYKLDRNLDRPDCGSALIPWLEYD